MQFISLIFCTLLLGIGLYVYGSGNIEISKPNNKLAPLNAYGIFVDSGDIEVRWRYPKGIMDNVIFHAKLYSNCNNPEKIKEIEEENVKSSRRIVIFSNSLNREHKCAIVCVLNSNQTSDKQIDERSCTYQFSISHFTNLTKKNSRPISKKYSPLNIKTSLITDTSTTLTLDSVKEEKFVDTIDVRITCWVPQIRNGHMNHKYKIIQQFNYKQQKSQTSVDLNGLIPNITYKCAADGKSKTRMYYSQKDVKFKTLNSHTVPPPAPIILQNTKHKFALELLPSALKKNIVSFYELIAVPILFSHNSKIINRLKPYDLDPNGNNPNSILHSLVAEEEPSPKAFIVYRIPPDLLPRKVKFSKWQNPNLWKSGIKYSFMLIAGRYSSQQNSQLDYAVSRLSKPILVNRLQKVTTINQLANETTHETNLSTKFLQDEVKYNITEENDKEKKILVYILSGILVLGTCSIGVIFACVALIFLAKCAMKRKIKL